MRHRTGFIAALLALIALCSLAGCSDLVQEPEQPPGQVYSDGTIRSGRGDTVWVRDNDSGQWMLYMMMMNNGRMWYQPSSHAITYHHVITHTTASAPIAKSPAYRYVSPRVKPYTGSGQPWNPSTRALTSPANRAASAYTPKTSTYRPSTSTYRPSTATSTFRSSPMTSTYRPMSSGRPR